MTKPQHKQKDKAANADSAFGERRLASDAWGWSQENEEDDPSWATLKRKLVQYHDSADTISLQTLVKTWNDAETEDLRSLGATLSFDHARRLLEMAREANASSDFHDAKVMILAAGVVLQSRVTDIGKIADFVEKNGVSSDEYGTKLAETLPFCSAVVEATKSPATMAEYLDTLDADALRAKAAAAEPLVDIVFKDGTVELPAVERTVKGVNTLLTLNAVLSTHGGVSKISSVRVKHNGQRLFLSGAGRRSLADLGIKTNDVLELEPANAMSVASIDSASLNQIPYAPGQGSVPGKSTKRRLKKKGKGRK